jgi:hypothetical protein
MPKPMVTLTVSIEPEIAGYMEYFGNEKNETRHSVHREILTEWYNKKKMEWLEKDDKITITDNEKLLILKCTTEVMDNLDACPPFIQEELPKLQKKLEAAWKIK